MAEQTQTEKLDNLIEPILVKVYDMALHSKGKWVVRRDTLNWAKEEARKALKEVGLKFTKVGVKGDLEGACICKVEEIVI